MAVSAVMVPRVVLASSNAGKLREFAELLAGQGLALVRQSELGIAPPPETGSTFLDNALIKARNASRLAGLPAIADDSGIEVDALGGAPGVHSARFAGENASDEANLEKLLQSLEGLDKTRRGARYRCVIVYVAHADDPEPLIGEGSWNGAIISERRGGMPRRSSTRFRSSTVGCCFTGPMASARPIWRSAS